MEEVVSDLKTYAHKGFKIAEAKQSLLQIFSIVFLPPLPDVQCPNFLDFWNPLGKIMERSGLRFDNFCS